MYSIINRSRIRLSWDLAYIGVERNWISAEDVMKKIDPSELAILDVDVIGELYSNSDDGKEKFLSYIRKFTGLTENSQAISLRTWAYAFFIDIAQSQTDEESKLQAIAAVYALFDYPEEWISFIYYMPEGNDQSFKEPIYSRFINFSAREASVLEPELS